MHDTVNEYVVGIAYDEHKNVVLIRKTHPEWQAGKLNGVGGKVEPGETPFDAMVREFEEETGGYEQEFQLFLIIDYPETETRLYFYKVEISRHSVNELKSPTDEEILVIPMNAVAWYPHMKNLSWIIPLALYTDAVYSPTIHISASYVTEME